MPQIIVAADRGAAFGEGAVTFRERVNVADFESQHFAAQLVERLGWAVEDADLAEQIPDAHHGTEQAGDRAQAPPARDPIQAPPAHDRNQAPPDDSAEGQELQRDARELQHGERLTAPSPA
jgi:hypothetical protein